MSDFPHLSGITKEMKDWINELAVCRDENCDVPKKHPFYPTPEQPPLYAGKRPCMPVVPTNLARNKIMLIGQYPNARFATVKPPKGRADEFVTVADVNEPFESGRYYDGRSIRDYPTAESLRRYYFEPLGVDVREDVWLTNINKCHLLQDKDIKSYERVGWTEPPTEASYSTSTDYLRIAAACVPLHLVRELEMCQPKLVILVGAQSYRLIHGSDDFKEPAPDGRFTPIRGVLLRANKTSHEFDTRNATFRQYNVVHLAHPSSFLYPNSYDSLHAHLNEHIPAVRTFLHQVGLL